jgi:hypothetical protein
MPHAQICQACHRVNDRSPAGVFSVHGEFAQNHRNELLQLIRHREREENREYPLHRIMQVDENPGLIVIKTTDIHLPHAIGEALRHAYQGRLRDPLLRGDVFRRSEAEPVGVWLSAFSI